MAKKNKRKIKEIISAGRSKLEEAREQERQEKELIQEQIKNNPKAKWYKRLFALDTFHGKVIVIGGVAILSMTAGYSASNFYLSGNVNGGTVATYKGGSIESSELYNQLKNNLDGSNLVLKTLLFKSFGEIYGDKISNEDVKKAYPNYLNAGLSIIGNKGTNEKDLKELVKQQLALQYGLKEYIKVEDSELNEWWKSYHPDVTIKVMQMTSEEKANSAVARLQSGDSFSDVTKEYDDSGLEGKDVVVSSDTKQWSADELNTIYGMADGEVKIMIQQAPSVTGEPTTYYYVVKMVENIAKGDDMNKWKSDMSDQIKDYKIMAGLGEVNISDTDKAKEYNAMVKNGIKKVFKKANVRVTDVYMRKALNEYLED